MSYKVFSNGNVLNASELNEFLMNQSVIAFSNATARSSAITSPVEGMLTWLEDVNRYEFYNGSAWEVLISPSTGNAIINGAFDIWQRGTSFTATGYTADRWSGNWNGTGTRVISRQAFSPGTAPVAGYEGEFFFRANQTTAGTGSTFSNFLDQKIENVRTFAGQTITVSFFAKADANRTISVVLQQEFGTGGSSAVFFGSTPFSLTTSWQRFTLTVQVPSVSGKTIGANSSLGVVFTNSTLNAAQTIDIWGVQLEAGPVATPFKRNANSLQGELAACQRYYEKSYNDVVAPNGADIQEGMPQFTAANANNGFGSATFKVTKRAVPTVTIYAGAGGSGAGSCRSNTGATVITGAAAGSISPTGFANIFKTSGFTTGHIIGCQYTAEAEL